MVLSPRRGYIAQQITGVKGKQDMKWLIAAVLLCAALVSGWWVLGAWGHERVVRGWFEARAAEGWVANYSEVSVSGFPWRFDTRISALDLADPETGWVWTAPQMRFTQDAIRPDRLRATWPDMQTLASPFERLEITSATMTSDLDVQPAGNFALDASETILRDVEITSSAGWSLSLPEGALSARRVAGEDAVYDLAFSARDIRLPVSLAGRLDPGDVLPERVERLASTARVAFDAPWDLAAIEVARPQPTRIELEEAAAQWGDLLLRATGTLDVDAAGRPVGELAIRAENWREIVVLADNAGVLPTGLRGTAEAFLGLLAAASGRPEDIDAALRFADGRVYLGPIPLGPAPVLRLR